VRRVKAVGVFRREKNDSVFVERLLYAKSLEMRVVDIYAMQQSQDGELVKLS
jgi:hypothetical protein